MHDEMDMKKTYDSLEWSFLEQVLIDLQIPRLFIQWIMQCVTTVTYSLTINGKAITPFLANKE